MNIITSLAVLLPFGLALGMAGCSSSENEPALKNIAPVNAAPAGPVNAAPAAAAGGMAAGGSAAVPAAPAMAAMPSAGGMAAAPAAGAAMENFDPPCNLATTAAGLEIKKAVACDVAAGDPELCWRSCGPQSGGWKSETCNAGSYMEGKCQFPSSGDYSCYKIPAAIDAVACPVDLPKSSQPCDVPECTLCNVNGQYFDSGGSLKVGYCVCQSPNAAGTRKWSCSSGTAWPCPTGNGCK